MTKYGILLEETEDNNAKIMAFVEFPEGNLPEGYEEILRIEYDNLLSNFDIFQLWDKGKRKLVLDATKKNSFEAIANLSKLRIELKAMYFEIQFMKDLEEDTEAIEEDYATKKTAYLNQLN